MHSIRKIFKGKNNFFFRTAETINIDTDNKVISTSIGNLNYDILIISTGATSNYFRMKNIQKYVMLMKDVVEALNISDLEKRERLMNFIIVGEV